MAKKSGRIIVTLECTEARAQGKPVSRYTTTKNKTKTPVGTKIHTHGDTPKPADVFFLFDITLFLHDFWRVEQKCV